VATNATPTKKLAEHAHRAELVELARVERDRRDAAEAERERLVEQERAERTAEHAEHERDKALRKVREELGALENTVAAFLRAETALEVASHRAGRRCLPLTETCAELCITAVEQRVGRAGRI